MLEPIIEPTPIDPAEELATLRTTNAELLAKRKRDKQRIVDIEASVAAKDVEHLSALTAKDEAYQTALTAKDAELSKLQTTVRQLTIDGPLMDMAEELSPVPELWLEQFSKSYKLEMVAGKLTVLTAEGKPVVKGDKPIAFERQALIDLVTDEKHPQAKTFKAITAVSRASGAASTGTQRRAAPATAPKKLQFGLR